MTVNIPRAITNTLKTAPALAGPGKIFRTTFNQPGGLPAWPAVRFTFVGNTPYPALCGDEPLDVDDVRVQFDVVVETNAADADALARAVCDAIAAGVITQSGENPLPAVRESYFDEWDVDTKTHRRIIDFVFYPSSL